MSWHYQAILTLCGRHQEVPILQVHEVYSGGFGYTVDGMTPSSVWEEDGEPNLEGMRQALINILEMMLNDVRKYPALDKRADG